MNVKRTLVMAGAAALLCCGAQSALAQNGGGGGGGGGFGGGGFDPAQMMQRRMDRIHEQMGVTNDAEWNVIQARVQKVFDAQMAMFGFRGRGGGRPPGGGGDNGGRRGGFGGPPSPELESLQNAIESNAPSDQIKAAMDKFRAARKAKEEALQKAQDDLKAVLTVKQEAVALSSGLLN